MGYMRHNAIVVTSWKEEAIKNAAAMAEKIGLRVLSQSEEVMNGYRSLLVCPDGSKEGWEESDRGEEKRGEFKKWLNEQRYEDGSSALEWVEIAYGSDDATAEIVAHAWMTPNDKAKGIERSEIPT